jgi:hypothetical protein
LKHIPITEERNQGKGGLMAVVGKVNGLRKSTENVAKNDKN